MKNFEIKKKIHELLLLSSAHGLPRLIRAESSLIKILWLIVIITSISFGSYLAILNTLDYLKYESVTTMSLIEETEVEFPTVSFCSLYTFSAPLNETILSLEFNNNYETNLDNFFERFDHPVYNSCYRFNSGKNIFGQDVPILRVNEATSNYGLKIELNLNVPNEIDYSEIVLDISNRSLKFELNDGSFCLSTGSLYFYQIDRVLRENLPEPYNNCLKDVSLFKLNKTLINYFLENNKTYSQKDCFRLCSIMFAIRNSSCQCNATLKTFHQECEPQWFEFNTNNSIKVCIRKYLNDFRIINRHKSCLDQCPLECDRLNYVVNSQVMILPINDGEISKTTLVDAGIRNFRTYKEVKKNYVCFFVYYNDLKYTKISQIPKTELFGFISSIGGIFSLFLGVSFLSFFEVLEIFLEALRFFFNTEFR